MNPEWFAGRLRELRVAKAWTQVELAERAGLSKAGIADLEQGRREPGWSTVLALGQALGVTCEEFQRQPAEATRRGPGRPASGSRTAETKKPRRGRSKGN
jgi:transcriptional regulator with XRE-family HTH domain